MQMVTDGHNSYVGRESDFYKTCRNRDVQLLLTEPGSAFHGGWLFVAKQGRGGNSRIEAALRQSLENDKYACKLWDHLFEWCSDIRNITALNIPELHGRTPTERERNSPHG